jgi:hypothetical protein
MPTVIVVGAAQARSRLQPLAGVGTGANLAAAVDTVQAAVALTLTWPAAATVTIVRVGSDGSTSPVRNAEPGVVTGSRWIGTDYEAPLDYPVFYRAVSPDYPSVVLTSPSVTVPSGGYYWLKHPGNPALNMQVTPADTTYATLNTSISQGVFQVLGGPVVTRSAPRWPYTGTLLLMTSGDDRTRIEAILADGSALLYQTPAAIVGGEESGWISIGNVDRKRIGYEIDNRVFSLPVTYTTRPAGAALIVSATTWAEIEAKYPNWGAVKAANPTWADVLAGGR